MCQIRRDSDRSGNDSRLPPVSYEHPFPWHLPVFDAHCHPTDTMSSVASFTGMRTNILTIMATRSQDQHLVAEVASTHGVKGSGFLRGRPLPMEATDSKAAASAASATLSAERGCQVVPSFGWHPWFSYQLYDDAAEDSTYNPPTQGATQGEDLDQALLSAKKVHYQAVLAPSRDDDAFIASLPTPVPLSTFIESARSNLIAHPHALVGEIGLDKAFRLPQKWDPDLAASRDEGLTPGGREGRLLSPYRVRMPHQERILLAQLRLAGEVGRPVSVHGVQAHGTLYDTVATCWKGHEKHIPSRREKRMVAPGAEDNDESEPDAMDSGGKPYPPRICLHSYTGSLEGVQRWTHRAIPARIFFSFSTAVNLGTDAGIEKFAEVVKAVPDDRILVESDLHIAGEGMDTALEDMYRRVCDIKGWGLEVGVQRIGRNYEEFIYGKGSTTTA